MSKKYEFIEEVTRNIKGRTVVLHKIKALRDFGDVKAGDIGGLIEKEENLSQEGNCWVYDDAIVYDNATVLDNAVVSGNAIVYDNATVLDNAVVSGNAIVYDNAYVLDDAVVSDHAIACDNAYVCGDAKISGKEKIQRAVDASDTTLMNGTSYIMSLLWNNL